MEEELHNGSQIQLAVPLNLLSWSKVSDDFQLMRDKLLLCNFFICVRTLYCHVCLPQIVFFYCFATCVFEFFFYWNAHSINVFMAMIIFFYPWFFFLPPSHSLVAIMKKLRFFVTSSPIYQLLLVIFSVHLGLFCKVRGSRWKILLYEIFHVKLGE